MPIPSKCPSCGGEFEVTKLSCRTCKAVIEGSFSPCPVCRLSAEDLEIFDLFMEARGNLKEVQRALGLSYPTVRNRVETMFEHYDERNTHTTAPMEVLRKLREGEIDVEEAEKLLKRGR